MCLFKGRLKLCECKQVTTVLNMYICCSVHYQTQSSSCLLERDLQNIHAIMNSSLEVRTEKYIQFSTMFSEDLPEVIPADFTKLILMLARIRKNLEESELPYQ